MEVGGGGCVGVGGRLSEAVEIWQWKGVGGAVDRQTRVSKRGCSGVATLAAKRASEVFCTTSGAGGRDC